MIHIRRDSKGMFRFILSILFILAIPTILSSLFSCRVTVEGDPYYQGSGPGPGPRPAHSSRIDGRWSMTVDNRVGKLEFYWTGSTWTGRVWFDAYQQWEELMDIYFDPHTGQLQFTRPNFNSRYNGSLSGNQIIGTFIYAGVSYPWEARRF